MRVGLGYSIQNLGVGTCKSGIDEDHVSRVENLDRAIAQDIVMVDCTELFEQCEKQADFLMLRVGPLSIYTEDNIAGVIRVRQCKLNIKLGVAKRPNINIDTVTRTNLCDGTTVQVLAHACSYSGSEEKKGERSVRGAKLLELLGLRNQQNEPQTPSMSGALDHLDTR